MKAQILAALVVLSSLVAPATAVQDAGNSELTVQQTEQLVQSTANAGFESTLFIVTTGDVAEMTVELTDAEEATVVVGDEDEVGYELVATVTDENGDGTATLLFDTSAAYTDEQSISVADDGDDIVIEDEMELEHGPLDIGDYPLQIRIDGELKSLATLNITPLEISVTEDSKELAPNPNEVIEIQTNREPGSTLNVQIQGGTNKENALVDSDRATVQEDGIITPEFDLSGAEDGTEMTVAVLGRGEDGGPPEDTAVIRNESSASSSPGQPGFGFLTGVVAVLLTFFVRRQR